VPAGSHAIAAAEAVDKKAIVTIGIEPSYPSTGYGYIETLRGKGLSLGVKRFVEKPSLSRAARFVKDGRYFWNSGIFICEANVLLSAIRAHILKLSRMLDSFAKAPTASGRSAVIRRRYPGLENVSLDYGIMEKYPGMRMVKATFKWDDLGSWKSVARFGRRDAKDNRAIGEHIGIDSNGCVFITEPGHVLATIGLTGYTVITTEDATLIARSDRLQEVRRIVARLKKRKKYKKYLYSR